MARLASRWAYLTVEESPRIIDMSAALYDFVSDSTYEREDFPHITIHGGFNIPQDKVGVVEQWLQRYDLRGTEIALNGIDCWPSREKPLVVMLDVRLAFAALQNELYELVEDSGGQNAVKPVPAHITLLKADTDESAEDWEGPPSGVHNALRSGIGACAGMEPDFITVEDVQVRQTGTPERQTTNRREEHETKLNASSF